MNTKAGFIAATLALGVWLTSFPSQAQISLPGLPLGLRVGCPWIRANDAESNNTGVVDVAATYYVSAIPVNPGNGATIRIRGAFPKVRYFGFQTYDGFRPGNDIDTLPDARIVPDQGGSLNANPAVLPGTNGYTNTYTISIVFTDVPRPPALRPQNTLYAGSGTGLLALNKQVIYRIYLPNTGIDDLGGKPLPQETFVGPQGEIDFNNTPDSRSCATAATLESGNRLFPILTLGQGQANVGFTPVSGSGGFNFYPDADGNFLRAQVGKSFGDLILVRKREPSTPVEPPAVVNNPNVRYYSICQYQSISSAVVGCIADRDTRTQADGYSTTVISTPAKRPALAYPANGYNWLPFGDASNALIALRQILSNPNFAGNYALAVAQTNAPIANTLGVWAPRITYCDSATFAAVAGSGGAAVFDACKAAADSRRLLGGLFP